jgi:hypothetical protein
VAHPCPATPCVADAQPGKGIPALNHIILDTVDAMELIEILEFFMERLDVLAEHDLAKLFFAECCPYGLEDLRADLTRLINNLNLSPLAP